MENSTTAEGAAASMADRKDEPLDAPAEAARPPAAPSAASREIDAQLGASRDEGPDAASPASLMPPAHASDLAPSATQDNLPSTANGDTPAKEKTMADALATPGGFATPLHRGSRGRGRGTTRVALSANGTPRSHDVKMEDGALLSSARGRPRGRPRGSRGRGSGGRGGKRKRNDDDDDDDDDASDSSEEVTPIATMTKSGRSIQKPTNFVPPPQSPSTKKRKRPFARRNPESAVCKACLRGTSPASNMIVFCDGCNAPYHRWCHKPPIDPAVVEEVDREWFCKQCESERVIPVPESDVANFVSAGGASAEQRQKYFSSLPPGLLVTLLTKATSLHPGLPLFDPDFVPKQPTALSAAPAEASSSTNGHNSSVVRRGISEQPKTPFTPSTASQKGSKTLSADIDPDEKYSGDVHPSHYPRPGQGLMSTLPPEENDLHYLVDDEDKFGVFTHVYQKAFAAAKTDGASSHVTHEQ